MGVNVQKFLKNLFKRNKITRTRPKEPNFVTQWKKRDFQTMREKERLSQSGLQSPCNAQRVDLVETPFYENLLPRTEVKPKVYKQLACKEFQLEPPEFLEGT